LFIALFANAFWNYVCFRLGNLRWSFLVGMLCTLIAITLLAGLFVVDRTAGWWFLLYVGYLTYANAWGYALARINTTPRDLGIGHSEMNIFPTKKIARWCTPQVGQCWLVKALNCSLLLSNLRTDQFPGREVIAPAVGKLGKRLV
jgi:hypothetical protein